MFMSLTLGSIFIANPEESFEIHEPDVHGSEKPHLGLELAGEVDGREAMGEPRRPQ